MATQTAPTSPDDEAVERGQAWRAWEGLPPDTPPDIAVGDPEPEWRNWMGIAIGLVGMLSIMAIILSAFALAASSSDNNTASAATGNAAAPASSTGALGNSTAPLAKPETIKLAVKADDEHGRLGPDGKWHDAFLPADFTVRPGAKVTVTVTNYDGGAHSFTSPALRVNAVVAAGSMQHPHQTTFTFTAPKQAGRYAWWCAMPCDPWAMAHDGYMRGYVTVAG